ncbi:bifunctional metallophosphatase/5'-nucleotidase [Metabacillus arenae]|uniref:5'-nucleotidase C-terminal domain-containing protein n=1 Tax=Metabacillus arenae TaxID=2771434 RepID=A0A926NHM0_9BACI|nr:5'-nucleotidase C-terminal domain-containing protein [Metabacillus arenae]MBD1381446.1 5'-nucleotidase C-terminal domain-containing protein [Metabacillus arenae]
MKRIFVIVFSIALTLSMIGIGTDASAKEKSRKATILYFNDAHEISPVVNSYGDRGGVARLKTVIDKVRAENKKTIVTFGGDLGGGTLFGGVFQGYPIVEAFNKMNIDLANFGQHDFDFGSEITNDLVSKSDFQWISSNLTDAEGNPFAEVPTYKIYNVKGIKIGFISLTDDMHTTTQDGSVIQQDLISSAKKAVKKMKKRKKVDVIVALTQESLEKDKLLLDAIPEIDVVFTEEKAEDQSFIYPHEDRFILAPEGNIGSVIRLDIHKQKKEINIQPEVLEVDNRVPEDPKMKAFADYYQNKLDEELGKTIAKLETPLLYGENHESRYQETNIGNFVADSYRAFYKADIGFMMGGGIRSSVDSGNFTLRDAYSILPFRNKVVLASIKGETIRAALENGVSKVENQAGGFLQVSGVKYSYHPENSVGERVTEVLVNQEPLLPNKDYLVAMPSYMYNNGDGFNFNGSETIVAEENARTDAEVLIEYAKSLKVIQADVEGRITVLK